MPAYARPENGALVVTFFRDGEEDDQRIAANGVKAVTLAMRMLAAHDELRPGDRLTVQANHPRPIDPPPR